MGFLEGLNLFTRRLKTTAERSAEINNAHRQNLEQQKENIRKKELEKGVPYEIRKGDNLTLISKATGISIYDLSKDNGIKNQDSINAGDTIFFKRHPEKWEAINSPELNEMTDGNFDWQEGILRDLEDADLLRYRKVADFGAKDYLKYQE